MSHPRVPREGDYSSIGLRQDKCAPSPGKKNYGPTLELGQKNPGTRTELLALGTATLSLSRFPTEVPFPPKEMSTNSKKIVIEKKDSGDKRLCVPNPKRQTVFSLVVEYISVLLV